MIARRSTAPAEPLSKQVAGRLSRGAEKPPPEPVSARVISTGSTLLDLAISGGRYPEGGIPPGILVEIFGPSGCGKTVLLCEIAGAVQRQGGEIMFRDPEARLDAQFAKMFGFEVGAADYSQPNTVPEVFAPIREWEPTGNGINAIFADSLAALSTDMEMGDKDGMGMRRAKEFSEECRRTCRVLKQRGFLMVCSNQIRDNPEATQFGEKFTTPGGKAIGFYSSLRLRCHSPEKIRREVKIDKDKKIRRVVGVATTIDVYKSSVWEPHHSAQVSILYDYGVDDIRSNLEFVKSIAGPPGAFYSIDGNERLGSGLEHSIRAVEEGGLERQLKQRVIQLWHELEEKFKVERQPKRRT